MKVGLVSTLARGGPVEHTVTLAGALGARGVEVLAACATPEVAERLAAAGARAAVIPLRHQLDAGGARRMRRALAGVDVVHGQDRRAGLWTGLLRARRRGARLHRPRPARALHAAARRERAARACARGSPTAASTRSLARRGDAVIAVSRAVERVLVTRSGWPAGADHGDPQRRRARRRAAARAATLVGTLDELRAGQGARRLPRRRGRAARVAPGGALRAVRRRRAEPPRCARGRARSASTARSASPARCRRARRSRGWACSCSPPTWRTRRWRCSRRWRPACRSSRRASAACRRWCPRAPGSSSRPATRRRWPRRSRGCSTIRRSRRAQAEAARRHVEAGGGADAMADAHARALRGPARAVRVLLATPGTDVGGAERVVIALAHDAAGARPRAGRCGARRARSSPSWPARRVERVVLPDRGRSPAGVVEGVASLAAAIRRVRARRSCTRTTRACRRSRRSRRAPRAGRGGRRCSRPSTACATPSTARRPRCCAAPTRVTCVSRGPRGRAARGRAAAARARRAQQRRRCRRAPGAADAARALDAELGLERGAGGGRGRAARGAEEPRAPARRRRGASVDARFLIVGDGPLRAELEAQAAALGLGDRVTLTGVRHDVPALLARADLVVLLLRLGGAAARRARGAGGRHAGAQHAGRGDARAAGRARRRRPARWPRGSRRLLAEPGDSERAGRAYVAEHHSATAMLDGYTALYRELSAARGR